ncbi:hypothetical protein [Klebsiella pneumoniae IS39]|nr:hypothetical protein [Klebsiella pneumoniae IS39]
MRRLGAKGVQALPGLPGQHQQWQQDQHKRERHQLTQRTGGKERVASRMLSQSLALVDAN